MRSELAPDEAAAPAVPEEAPAAKGGACAIQMEQVRASLNVIDKM